MTQAEKHVKIWYMNSYLVITLNLPLAYIGYILVCILPYGHLFNGSGVNHWIKYLCLPWSLHWAPDLPSRTEDLIFPALGMCCLTALRSQPSPRIAPGQRMWSLSWGKSASNYWLIWGYKDLTSPTRIRDNFEGPSQPQIYPWGWLSPLMCVTALQPIFFLCLILLSFFFSISVDPNGTPV